MMDVKIAGKTHSIEWNAVDRVVSWISPRAGLERIRSRVFLNEVGGYDGGRRDRRMLRNFRPKATSANEVNKSDLEDLRNRSRELVRNSPIATSAVNTNVNYVIGDGLVAQPSIDKKILGLTDEAAAEWQEAARREFELWAKSPDFTGRLNFDEMQKQVYRSYIEGGDVFVARRKKKGPRDIYNLKLLVIEGERVGNPNYGANQEGLTDGIVTDVNGIPTHYWIANHYRGDTTAQKDRSWTKYEIGSTITGQPLILHLFDQVRPGQCRGVPYLAPVIEAIKSLTRYQEAEITAAVVSSMFTVFVKKETVTSDGDAAFIGDAAEDSNTDPEKEIQLGNGAIVDLAEGESIENADPKRPNTAFDGFVKSMSQLIGAALNIPSELLLKKFEASYSASRAALEVAWQYFNAQRVWFMWKFCQTIYEWVITEAIIAGRLEANGFFLDPVIREAWLGNNWVSTVSRISLDPSKEAEAWAKHLELGTTNRKIITMEYDGRNWDDVHAQLAREEEQRKKDNVGQAPPPGAGGDNPFKKKEETDPDNPDKEPEDGEEK